VLVTKIGPGGAQISGCSPGDFVRGVNGKQISTVADLAAAAAGKPGRWNVTIERGGQLITGAVPGVTTPSAC
jgi:S1-C subfamily serine protease